MFNLFDHMLDLFDGKLYFIMLIYTLLLTSHMQVISWPLYQKERQKPLFTLTNPSREAKSLEAIQCVCIFGE